MASGLIGTSTIRISTLLPANATGAVHGQTLSYTCPASGVRYAVITISAQASVASANVSDSACLMQAGGYASAASYRGSSAVSSSANSANSVQIILAPGQSWSAVASASNAQENIIRVTGEASLTASVLEIV